MLSHMWFSLHLADALNIQHHVPVWFPDRYPRHAADGRHTGIRAGAIREQSRRGSVVHAEANAGGSVMGRIMIALIGLAVVLTTISAAWTVQVRAAQPNHAVHHVLADNEGPLVRG